MDDDQNTELLNVVVQPQEMKPSVQDARWAWQESENAVNIEEAIRDVCDEDEDQGTTKLKKKRDLEFVLDEQEVLPASIDKTAAKLAEGKAQGAPQRTLARTDSLGSFGTDSDDGKDVGKTGGSTALSIPLTKSASQQNDSDSGSELLNNLRKGQMELHSSFQTWLAELQSFCNQHAREQEKLMQEVMQSTPRTTMKSCEHKQISFQQEEEPLKKTKVLAPEVETEAPGKESESTILGRKSAAFVKSSGSDSKHAIGSLDDDVATMVTPLSVIRKGQTFDWSGPAEVPEERQETRSLRTSMTMADTGLTAVLEGGNKHMSIQSTSDSASSSESQENKKTVCLEDGSVCPKCKTKYVDDALFCRKCGLRRVMSFPEAGPRAVSRKSWMLRSLNQTMMYKDARMSTFSWKQQSFKEMLPRFVMGPFFSALSLCAILSNAIFIGVHTQYLLDQAKGNTTSDESWTVFDWLEVGFCVFFMWELFLRFIADMRPFFFGEDKWWNGFDCFLVVLCVVHISLHAVGQGVFFSQVRLLKIVRLARVLRIIRVMRVFRSLRLMVYSIVNSMTELMWVFMLLFFLMWIVTILLMHEIMKHFNSAKDGDISITAEDHDFLSENFGTLEACLISLFQSICGGKDWSELYVYLSKVSWLCAGTFLFYIFFVVFGVLNVVTGAFVDSMRLVSQRDHDVVIEEELKRANTFRKDIMEIFKEADTDASGTLSWEEFEAHLQDVRVRAYFASLELDITEARALFLLLDVEEENEVPIQQFIEGCLRMRGNAKSIDVNMLLLESEKLLCKITGFIEYAEDKFEGIDEALGTCQQKLNSFTPEPSPRANSKASVASNSKASVASGRRPSNTIVRRKSQQGGGNSLSEHPKLQRAKSMVEHGHGRSRLGNAANMLALMND